MESIFDIINIPLAWIFKLCYLLVSNYGMAIILFALIAKLLMLPIGMKSEKGRLKMVSMQPKLTALQNKFKGDTKNPKYNEELQALYKEENYNPLAGCLPSLIQLPIILGLWNAIRQPLTYIVGLGKLTRYAIVDILYTNGVEKIVTALGNTDVSDFNKVMSWLTTNEIRVAQALSDDGVFEMVKNELAANQAKGLDIVADFTRINMNFFGLNLGMAPSDFGILAWTTLIPVISGVTSFLITFITQKVNAQPQAAGGGMNALLYTMPLISIWLGFSFPTGIGIYWIASNVFSIAQIFLLKLIVKPPVPVEKKNDNKEKKLNYTQIEKMKRVEKENGGKVIVVPEDEQDIKNTENQNDNK